MVPPNICPVMVYKQLLPSERHNQPDQVKENSKLGESLGKFKDEKEFYHPGGLSDLSLLAARRRVKF